MKTYAEYLTTMTVKTLNGIARDMGLKGYSKLRKAALVIVLDNAVAEIVPVILSVEVAAGLPAIVEIFAKAPESVPTARTESTPTPDTQDDLVAAYRAYRRTFRTATGPTQVKIANRLRTLSAQIRRTGFPMRTL